MLCMPIFTQPHQIWLFSRVFRPEMIANIIGDEYWTSFLWGTIYTCCIRDTCSTADIFIHCCPLLSCCPLLLVVVHCCSLLSIVVKRMIIIKMMIIVKMIIMIGCNEILLREWLCSSSGCKWQTQRTSSQSSEIAINSYLQSENINHWPTALSLPVHNNLLHKTGFVHKSTSFHIGILGVVQVQLG